MRGHWKTALAVLVGVALIVWISTHVDFAQVWEVARHANVWLLLVATVMATLIFPLRAIRWRIILEPVAPMLPLGMLWRSIAIGVMITNVYPARLGELGRAYALTRETRRVGFAAAFASLAVDRMFDAVVVIGLMLIGMQGLPQAEQATVGGKTIYGAIISGLVVLTLLVIVLYALAFFPGRIIGLYELFARRVAPGIEARGRDILTSFATGLGVLKHPGRFAAVLWWTIAHWLLQAWAFDVAMSAVGINLPFSASLFMQGVLAIAVSAGPTPGFFGSFELGAQVALGLYTVSKAQAWGFALTYHVFSYIPITVLGLYYFTRLGLHFRDVRAVATDSGPGSRSNGR